MKSFLCVLSVWGAFLNSAWANVNEEPSKAKKAQKKIRKLSSFNLNYAQMDVNELIKVMRSHQEISSLNEADPVIAILMRSAEILKTDWNGELARETARLVDIMMLVDAKEAYFLAVDPLLHLFLSDKKDRFIDLVKERIDDQEQEDLFLRYVGICVRMNTEGNG